VRTPSPAFLHEFLSSYYFSGLDVYITIYLLLLSNFFLISTALLLLSFDIISALIMMKVISNSSVTILIEFTGNARPFVIGFGTGVITHIIVNTIVPPDEMMV